jgi:hypothetical protein
MRTKTAKLVVARKTKLTARQKDILQEALRKGEEFARDVESRTIDYGRWLLDEVFDGDTTAALEEKAKNPIWLELLRRAGGPSLRVSRRMLNVAVRIAAWDKRITDQSWRGLDAGRKELLLPLGESKMLRDAAERVSRFNLSQTKTREYVHELLAKKGEPPTPRITGAVLSSRLRKLRESVGTAAALRKIRSLELKPKERAAILREIEQLNETLRSIARGIKR